MANFPSSLSKLACSQRFRLISKSNQNQHISHCFLLIVSPFSALFKAFLSLFFCCRLYSINCRPPTQEAVPRRQSHLNHYQLSLFSVGMSSLDNILAVIAARQEQTESKESEKTAEPQMVQNPSSQENIDMVKQFVANWKATNCPPAGGGTEGATGGTETARMPQYTDWTGTWVNPEKIYEAYKTKPKPIPGYRHIPGPMRNVLVPYQHWHPYSTPVDLSPKSTTSPRQMEQAVSVPLTKLLTLNNSKLTDDSMMEIVDEGVIDVVGGGAGSEIQISGDYMDWNLMKTGDDDESKCKMMAIDSEWSFEEHIINNFYRIDPLELQETQRKLQEMTASRDEAMCHVTGCKFILSSVNHRIEMLKNENAELKEAVKELQKYKQHFTEELEKKMRAFIDAQNKANVQLVQQVYAAQMNTPMRLVPDTPASSVNSSPENRSIQPHWAQFLQFTPQGIIPQFLVSAASQMPTGQPQPVYQAPRQQPPQKRRIRQQRPVNNPASESHILGQEPPQLVQIPAEWFMKQSEAANAVNPGNPAQPGQTVQRQENLATPPARTQPAENQT